MGQEVKKTARGVSWGHLVGKKPGGPGMRQKREVKTSRKPAMGSRSQDGFHSRCQRTVEHETDEGQGLTRAVRSTARALAEAGPGAQQRTEECRLKGVQESRVRVGRRGIQTDSLETHKRGQKTVHPEQGRGSQAREITHLCHLLQVWH